VSSRGGRAATGKPGRQLSKGTLAAVDVNVNHGLGALGRPPVLVIPPILTIFVIPTGGRDLIRAATGDPSASPRDDKGIMARDFATRTDVDLQEPPAHQHCRRDRHREQQEQLLRDGWFTAFYPASTPASLEA
jgi:hypothetical protein